MKRHAKYQVRIALVWTVTSYVPWLVTHYVPWLAQNYFPWLVKDFVPWKVRYHVPWLVMQFLRWLGNHIIPRDNDESEEPRFLVEEPKLLVEEPKPPRLVPLYRWNRLQDEQQEQQHVPETEQISETQEHPVPS